MTKRFKLTAIFSIVAMFLVSLLLSISLYVAPVAAALPSTFEMVSGASVKLSGNGLRFKAKMSQDYYDWVVTNDETEDVNLYGYIAPVEEFDKVDGKYEDILVKVGGVLDEGTIYKGEDGYYYVNIVITNLDKYASNGTKLYDKSFSAIVFIEDWSGADVVYEYADFAKDENGSPDLNQQNRTQYEVVNAAMLDGDESYENRLMSAYGSWYSADENHPVIISTETDYQSFVSKLAVSNEFKTKMNGKNVFVKQAVSEAVDGYSADKKISAYVSVEEATGHIVTYYDGYSVIKLKFVEDGGSVSNPASPSREGYSFSSWAGSSSGVTSDEAVYATWKESKGVAKDIGNLQVYGASIAGGGAITALEDVYNNKIVLASGDLGDGAYYPGEGNPTDKANTADQAYIAFDGQYSFNDYFVADFTGKNMPMLAFFANNYNNSVFYGNGNKQGIVVSTGLTLPNGLLFAEGAGARGEGPFCTSVWDGHGLAMWGPKMIYSTSENGSNGEGVLLHENVTDTALGRANLVDGKHYRVVIGFEEGVNPNAITLVYTLFDLDTNSVVSTFSKETYGFFSGSNAAVGNMSRSSLKGSIVAYGYFGAATVLDKVYEIRENTTHAAVLEEFGMDTVKGADAIYENDSVYLPAASIGNGANYIIGQNNGGYVSQPYFALNGNYDLDDYVAFDFTGKNLPEIAFFAKNYNKSMYAEGTSKQGIVVYTGITDYQGNDVQVNKDKSAGTLLNYGFPYMLQDASNGGFTQDAFRTSALGRANLVDGKHYRVVMGFSGSGNTITLHWWLYDLDTKAVVEQSSMTTWGFFTGRNEQVGKMTINDLSGAIVLYSRFGTSTTIDKIHGVFENTTIDAMAEKMNVSDKTVVFKNDDGSILQSSTLAHGEMPEYTGGTPSKRGDFLYAEYIFIGWDKEIVAATQDAVYTACYEARGYNTSVKGNNATIGNNIVLGAGSIGDGANYTLGQNNGGYVRQAYYAIDGNYNLDDYVAFDFTGKNLPEIAFFAKNYNDSMYAEGTSKQGIVVVTGITTWDGQLSSGVNGNGTQINYGHPYMIQNASNGGFCQGAFASSALGRANLVDGKHYRVIMGFTGSGNMITLHWYLYDLDTNSVVEQSSMTTWGFFSGSNSAVGNMTINDLVGSIVLYGKFGVSTTIDKMWGVFCDTNISAIVNELNANSEYTIRFVDGNGEVVQESVMAYGATPCYFGETPTKRADTLNKSYTFVGWDKNISSVISDTTYTAVFSNEWSDNVSLGTTKATTQENGKIVLSASNLGDGANYVIGQNNGGYVQQSYLALDGNYNLDDYVVFDFTGKNLPEIAFFAKNYNDSMYAEGTSKQGIVVVTGITTWDGQLSSGVNGNGTQINYGHPYMIQNASNGGFCQGAFASSALGRANLVDGKHYRVIMGFTGSGNMITLHWYLYDLDTNSVVEQSSMTTWGFFSGSNSAVGNMTINDLVGSIVLYGKFGVSTTIDKMWGVFCDTNIDTVAAGFNSGSTYTVTFENGFGDTIYEEELRFGELPVFEGVVPTKDDDAMYSYEFVGWDKPISLAVGNVQYNPVFKQVAKAGINYNNAHLTNNDAGVLLDNSNIGNSAHYSGSNYLADTPVIGTVNQSYYAFDGNYSFNDYVVFDFTGKNMPSVAFFANNYNESMYYQNGDKSGLVVLTGLTTWEGNLYTEYGDSKSVWDGRGLLVGGPYMLHNTLNSGKNGVLGFQAVVSNSGNNTNVALGRANLVDGKQYRVIMGMEAGNNAASVRIVYVLYSITDNEVVETFAAETYNFFTTGFAKEGQTRDQYCQGSIVLYGHFGTSTTIDTVWGVYEDTTLQEVQDKVIATDGGEVEVPVSSAPDYSKYTDTFDFYAYSAYSDGTYEIDGVKYYIGKDLANLKQYSQYGEVGMTIYFPQNDCVINGTSESINKAKALIDDLAKVGIHKTILQDSRILYLSMRETAIVGSGLQFANNDELDAYIYNCVKDYANYPGVYGVQLGDEPKWACLEAYAAVYNSLKRVNTKYGFNLFIQYNLNPLNYTESVYDNYYPAVEGTYNWDNIRYTFGRDKFADCVTRYTAYINGFLDAMNPDSIMYDDYPLMLDKNGKLQISNSYIPCLQIVAKAASDRNIKFYNVTQAYENNADGSLHRRYMTEAGAKWLNNILLGFGAKQIAYYTYYTRSESNSTGGESYKDGSSFVDYAGNPTALYYTMKDILTDNQIFASTILQFDYQGSKYYKGSSAKSDNNHISKITVSNTFTKLNAFSVDKEYALVTELYDDENSNYMYMAMNITDPDATGSYTQTMTLTFNEYKYALVYRDGVFTEVALTNHQLTITAAPGEASFVIPYN